MNIPKEHLNLSYKCKVVSLKDINEDKKRLALMNRYVLKLECKEREILLLNQLIILFNTFKFAWTCFLLEIHAKDPTILHRFYAIMFELGFDTSGCEVDEEFLYQFRRMLDENETHKEILKSFCKGRWW